MRILYSLTYYRPNISGLTIYVERLAEALASRGHSATVLTSRHASHLPIEEMRTGVRIVRVPVATRMAKAPLMPRFADTAYQLAQAHDIVSIHLPQLESGIVAGAARAAHRPVILTYHCDLELPPGLLNRVYNQGVYAANATAGALADRIVAYTQDYADHSRFLKRFRDKVTVIPPPVVMPAPSAEAVEAFRAKYGVDDGPLLGFASRLAAEKGIEFAIDALPPLLEKHPNLRVLFAGPYLDVIGEHAYRDRMMQHLAEFENHWSFIGTLAAAELPAFYGSLGALLMTSVNSTESFGLVQVEAMLCGTPVIATNLPGVRQPVRMTGMGEIVPIADSEALAESINQVLENRLSYVRPRAEIETTFNFDSTIDAYEELFSEAVSSKRRAE